MTPTRRRLLADAGPLTGPARFASPALAERLIEATGALPGTPVHVVRSYLAPLGLAIAHRLRAAWATLDLDDDDEMLTQDPLALKAMRRLVGTFAPRYSSVCVASPSDATTIGRRHGIPVIAVANSVSLPDRTQPARSGGEHSILFVANLTYRPNVEAALSLATAILPIVRARFAHGVNLDLVGHYDGAGPIGALKTSATLHVRGFVDDLAPLYAAAQVVVVPLGSASGTRIKVIEAFAHRVPVVTTATGASGLGVRTGVELLIGETVEDLADATAALLEDRSLADKLSAAAFDYVRQNHAPGVVAGQLADLFADASSRGLPEL